MADPDSCVDGVDQMIETVPTIKQDLREELNPRRARLHSIDLDFVKCNTLTSQVSSYNSNFKTKKKNKEFHALPSSAVSRLRRMDDWQKPPTNEPNDLVSLCTPTREEGLGM